jgi:hypothetical protein
VTLASRIAGDTNITLDGETKGLILAAGSPGSSARSSCTSAPGDGREHHDAEVDGLPGYDRTIELRMHDWRYRPFLNNGVAVPVCTSVTVIYHKEILEPLAPKPASR